MFGHRCYQHFKMLIPECKNQREIVNPKQESSRKKELYARESEGTHKYYRTKTCEKDKLNVATTRTCHQIMKHHESTPMGCINPQDPCKEKLLRRSGNIKLIKNQSF